MSDPSARSNEKTVKPPQQTMVKLGPIVLVGPSAIAALLVVLAGIGAFLWYLRPSPSPLWISAGLWFVFIYYWNSAASNASSSKSRESPESRRVHRWLLNGGLLLLFIPIPGLTLRFVPATLGVISSGLAIHVGSFLLAIWARRHLGENWSAAVMIKVGHELVRTGPYALVRHPIYTAMLGMFVGTALVSGQLHALIGVAIILYAYWRKIGLEESRLREEFGDSYAAYQRETRALIPWLF